MATSIVVASANGYRSHLASERHGVNKTYCNREQARVMGHVGDVITATNDPERTFVLDASCRTCQRGYTYEDRQALA